MPQLRLSLILPTYNAESFLAHSLKVVTEELQHHFQDEYEVIVVDDGSTDKTQEVLNTFESNHVSHRVRKEYFPHNRGKFAAIKCGVQVARGEIIAFTDADLPFSLRSLCEMVHSIEIGETKIAIGDRNLRTSYFPKHPQILRRAATAILSIIVGSWVTPGYFDTQCGLKAYKAEIGRELFRLLHDEGFSGDIELLYIAIHYGLSPKRFPVHAQGSGPTTVRVFSDGIEMLYRIWRLRGDWKRGVYISDLLEKLSESV